MDAKYATIQRHRRAVRPALTVLASVVSRPTADRAVLDVGRKAIGTDHGTPYLKGYRDEAEFKGFSEEHATLAVSGAARDLRPGDTVEIVPGHGCTTVNLYDRYHAMRNGVVEAIWPVAGRGRSQ